METTEKAQAVYAWHLWTLRGEFTAGLSNVPKALREMGISEATWALLGVAKILAWNADKLDKVENPYGIQRPESAETVADLAKEITAAVMPLCQPEIVAKPLLQERIAKLEAECEHLRIVLFNRKGEVL